MSHSFVDCITPIIDTAIKIEIEDDYQKKIQTFVEKLIKVKE